MVRWVLKYRGKFSVERVIILTYTDQEAEATLLKDRYMDRFENPNVRWIPPLERDEVISSAEFPELRAKWANWTAPVDPAPMPVERVPAMSGTLMQGT